MVFSRIDWIVFASMLVISLGINIYYFKRGNKNLASFFLGGRNLPWFVAGISMVATTFAADTPLAVTELVAENGIAGNWLWWNALAGGMLTTFFFAHLWRRAGVLTEAEFIEIRYSGRPAAFLRGFKAVYLGLFMNVLILGWVNLAMVSILQVFFGLSPLHALGAVGGAMLFTAMYATLSGIVGIAVSDVFQFFVAMIACVILAVVVVNLPEIGGISGLRQQLEPTGALNFFPGVSDLGATGQGLMMLPLGSFFAFMAMQWWASWYPGAEPGGGGYVAQRMMSCRTEKDAFWATMTFNLFHFCVRPWPWIIVALSTLILYPELAAGERRLGFVMAMRDHLPVGLRGLLLTAFFGAYMSTVSTQLNWGSSYLVNDLFKRFSRKRVDDRKCLIWARLTTLLLMGLSLAVTTQIQSIKQVWEFIFQCGAGLGLVLIMRWFWWRINAWSEISATLAPFLAYAYFQFHPEGILMKQIWGDGYTYVAVVLFTTFVWFLVTHFTKPTDAARLVDFYVKIRPAGWWTPVDKRLNRRMDRPPVAYLFVCWFGGVVMLYSLLLFMGKLFFGNWIEVLAYLDFFLAGFLILRIFLPKTEIFNEHWYEEGESRGEQTANQAVGYSSAGSGFF